MNKLWKQVMLLAVALAFIGGCSPKVGSKEWCEEMNKKPKGEWSGNEAKDYAKSCIF
ncbi:MAG: DUF3012 domain-containing protein [Magnetococcales bacterium]|nr:DUF3012 domain-containing protein [Magnetococcales bacterium]